MTTRIFCVLDRSGSMGGLEDDVIGGFNSFLEEQQKLFSNVTAKNKKATLTLILFDNEYDVVCNNLPIEFVPPLTSEVYFTRGTTALLDATAKAIGLAKSQAKKWDKVVFFINTDGHENSSVEVTNDVLKKSIEECQSEKDWKFMYIGAGIDNFDTANGLGIRGAALTAHSGGGLTSSYSYMSQTLHRYTDTGNWNDGSVYLSQTDDAEPDVADVQANKHNSNVADATGK